jgi:acetyltransferase
MGAMDVERGIEILQEFNVPVSRFPQKAVRSLKAMYSFFQLYECAEDESFDFVLEQEKKGYDIIAKYSAGGEMVPSDALTLFETYGFLVTRSVTITDVSQVREAVESVGGVAVLKILSPDILHKSDAGGVTLSVLPDTAEQEYEAMKNRVAQKVPTARIEGVLVAEMIVEKGVEFIVGSIKDPNLGHAVMVGFGGIYVEVFRDVSFGLVPVSQRSARAMIEKLKSKALLRGVRGGELLDEEELLQSIGKMSKILEEHPEILTADMNPLVVFARGKGAKVLDARITLESRC